jgi:hypothetical protein
MSNSHEGQRMKPVDPPPPPAIRQFSTIQLIDEIKRRSLGFLLVALVIDQEEGTRWAVDSKGSSDMFKDVLTNVELEKIQRFSILKEK